MMQRPDVIKRISEYEHPTQSIEEVAREAVKAAKEIEGVLFANFGTISVPVKFDDTPEAIVEAIWDGIYALSPLNRRTRKRRHAIHEESAGRRRSDTSHDLVPEPASP